MSAGNRIACAQQADGTEYEDAKFSQWMVNAYDALQPSVRKRVQDAPFRLCCMCIQDEAIKIQGGALGGREQAEHEAFDRILAFAHEREKTFQKS